MCPFVFADFSGCPFFSLAHLLNKHTNRIRYSKQNIIRLLIIFWAFCKHGFQHQQHILLKGNKLTPFKLLCISQKESFQYRKVQDCRHLYERELWPSSSHHTHSQSSCFNLKKSLKRYVIFFPLHFPTKNKKDNQYLSPEGRMRKQTPRGSIKVNWSRNGISTFQFQRLISAFLGNSKMLYCVGGWVGGWMGGDFFPPPNAFIFKCVNKQSVLILNMALKIVYGNYIKSYDQFKFEIWKI